MPSPFGLDTLDSEYVETPRADLKRLRGKKALSPAQQKKLSGIQEILSGLPDWQTQAPWEKRQLALMEEIGKRIGIDAGGSGQGDAEP